MGKFPPAVPPHGTDRRVLIWERRNNIGSADQSSFAYSPRRNRHKHQDVQKAVALQTLHSLSPPRQIPQNEHEGHRQQQREEVRGHLSPATDLPAARSVLKSISLAYLPARGPLGQSARSAA